MKYILMKDILKNKVIKKKKEKYKNLFWCFCFPKYKNSFLLRKHSKFFRGFCFLEYKKFFWGWISFIFQAWGEKCRVSFDKYKKSFLFRKYKNFFNIRARMFHFQKYKDFFISGNLRKASFWENIRIFLILEPKSFISWNTRNFFMGADFIYFFKLGLA